MLRLSNEIKSKRNFNISSKETITFEDDIEIDMEYEEFIADPHLASLVNNNNEIIVNDTLYKFTIEDGLFFAHINDSTHLLSYIKENIELSEDINLSSRVEIIDSCEERTLYGGITAVDDQIFRYVAPVDESEDCYSGGSTVGSTTTTYPNTSEEVLQERISSLPECDGNAGGNWFQNLFGTSKVCRSYFDSKHRIKTEFWNQKWLIYKSVGCLTKTQRKRLGIWWASKSDEIHLGINSILLRYKYPEPKIFSMTHPSFNYNNEPLYLYDNKYHVESQIGSSFYIDTQLKVTKNSIPFFDFREDNFLNIFIRKLPYTGSNYEITNQSNIKQLYKWGINFLKKKYGSGKTDFAVIYQKGVEEIEVLYFGERISKTNENKIKKLFYRDISFVISSTWSENMKEVIDPETGEVIQEDLVGSWKFTPKKGDDIFRKYTYYELDFYGMARRGSIWKGNRMIRN